MRRLVAVLTREKERSECVQVINENKKSDSFENDRNLYLKHPCLVSDFFFVIYFLLYIFHSQTKGSAFL